MKNIAKSLLVAAFTAGLVTATNAADIKEKGPDGRRAVEAMLKEIGDDHWPEGATKVSEVGAAETDTTFFHIYKLYDKESQYWRTLFFDNDGKYLGYYELEYEPKDVEEGAFIYEAEDEVSEDGDSQIKVPISDKGPPGQITVGSQSAEFVKAPKTKEELEAEKEPEVNPEETEAEAAAAKLSAIDEAPPPVVEEVKVAEYRDWTITWSYKNETTRRNETKLVSVNAKFVELDNRTKSVIIESAKNGEKASIPFTSLSREDKDYLTEFLKK